MDGVRRSRSWLAAWGAEVAILSRKVYRIEQTHAAEGALLSP
jgi:hypothetical protein